MLAPALAARHHAFVRLLPLLLAGCGPAEGRFVEELYALSCEAEFVCHPEEVAAYYLDVAACVEAHAADAEALLEAYRPCEYQKTVADACLEAYAALECGGSTESIEVCDEVWDCDAS